MKPTKLSRVLSQLEKDVSNFAKRGSTTRTANYLAGRLNLLEKSMESAAEIYEKCVSELQDDDKGNEIETTYEQIRELYFEYRGDLMDTIDKVKIKDNANMDVTDMDSSNLKSSHNADLRLKNIPVPVFSGSYESWRCFHDLFVSLVHHNSSLSEIQKMHYLKTSVTGEAEKLLAHLGIANGNYTKAWAILQDRYDHPRFLVNSQLKTLFNLATTTQERAESIKELLDTSTEVVHSLDNLKVPVQHWDVVLVYILLQKLPSKTQQLWEERLGSKRDSKELPTFAEFTQFLETRFRTLEAVNYQQGRPSDSVKKVPQRNSFYVQSNTSKFICKLCNKGQHAIRKCNKFLKMSISDKYQNVNKLGLCINCLAYSHSSQHCPSTRRCYYCQQPHHSLLHNSTNHASQLQNQIPHFNPSNPSTIRNNSNPQSSHIKNINQFSHSNVQPPQTQTYITSTFNSEAPVFHPSNEEQPSTSSGVRNHHSTLDSNTQVLLSTAIVKVRTSSGDSLPLRALLDSGSEASFITESAVRLLRLKSKSTDVEVSGLGLVSSGTCKKVVDITIRSCYTAFQTTTQALVFQSLSGHLPARILSIGEWRHLNGLQLADPSFYKPAKIDLLLGSDILADIMLPDLIRHQEKTVPVAQKTKLGWILFGRSTVEPRSTRVFFQTSDVDAQLRRFWELEETPFEPCETTEDTACEEHFVHNVRRMADGRYQVALPFKENLHPVLGRSREGALQRFRSLERRLAADQQLHTQYALCIEEYLQLGHMSEVEEDDVSKSSHYFLPHHAVLKETGSTTKLRVVFDASYRTSDGSSLNDHLMTGPSLQHNVTDVTLRWRLYRFSFSADIEKMYRQIWVTELDSNYQLIFWRKHPTEQLKVFRLKTVTFGTASAPYLAIRTLVEVAKAAEAQYPRAAKMIRTEMYVDDLFSGADTIEEANIKKKEVKAVLEKAGFNLRKWTSNAEELLKDIPTQDRELSLAVPSEGSDRIKTLGIHWLPNADNFCFRFTPPDSQQPTKRFILSTIARLFDPMGWISPCILKAKLIMQLLWIQRVSWDEPIEKGVLDSWISLYNDLSAINDIRIPRWVQTVDKKCRMELHGFSDASEKAYGAAVYLRAQDSQGKVHMHLMMSKSKLAPMQPVSLPRLELCGAVTLAKLLNYVSCTLGLKETPIHAWTDSTITLAWILAPASRWETFVRNRVSEIQRLTDSHIWKHVPTQHNPADLASRGMLPSLLVGETLWWNGPEFLRSTWIFDLPAQPVSLSTEEGKRKVQVHSATLRENVLTQLIHRSSNLSRLVRVTAWCKRFINNAKSNSLNRHFGSFLPSELDNAAKIVARSAQNEMFAENTNSKGMGSLNPFVDGEGVLRVGGRLRNANIPYDQQHPIILEPRHHFTKLIIRDSHERSLHGGIQLMMVHIRQKYWILQFKRAVKKHINSCTTCYRFRSQTAHQLMGELPAPRVTVSRPFSHTGVDYAGPINIRAWKGRGSKCHKGYIAVFVCLATKAIHLEAVSDLTTQAFLAAFRRFTARRGVCGQIYSDCGTNFVGADTELRRLMKGAIHDWKEIADTTVAEGTQWNFIPPASPHFGGLWEAGVKSVKYHLKRIVGNGTLTFEELTTFLTQIEACLNSRPLCPLTENPDDFEPLTPAHFLIGTTLFSVPEPDMSIGKQGHIDRWKAVQAHLQTFWKQWQVEYLARLQQRPKWLKQQTQLKVGDLVLLKDERLPPAKWNLGRIQELYPGADNITRVVKIKTKQGILKRPITKLCPLPTNQPQSTNLEPEN